MADDRLPPQDVDSEMALLGALLSGAPDSADVFSTLPAGAFAVPQHRTIFAIAKTLHDAGTALDLAAFVDEAKRRNIETEIGGDKQSLMDLAIGLSESFTVPENLPLYVGIVREHWQRRCLIAAGHRLAADARDLSQDVDAVLSGAVGRIEAVNDGADAESESAVDVIASVAVDDDSPAIESGLAELDGSFGFLERGAMTLIGAYPSVGKTALGLQAAVGSSQSGTPSLFVSVEMGKQKIGARLVALLTGESCFNLRNLSAHERVGLCKRAAGLLGEGLFISRAQSITDVIATAKRHIRRDNVGLVVVDYVQLIRSTAKAENRNLEVASLSAALKRLAMDYGVAVLALSQLSRQGELRDSGTLLQDADFVAMLSRNRQAEVGDDVEVGCKVTKNRNGPTGEIVLNLHKPTMRISCGVSAVSSRWHPTTNGERG